MMPCACKFNVSTLTVVLTAWTAAVSAMQAQHKQPDPGAAMRAQRGARAVAARVLILHAGKLVALALFCAAMQLPGLLGWVLTGDVRPRRILGGNRPARSAAYQLPLVSCITWCKSIAVP